ncbi:MAG: hypothetical protein DI598_00385 [Pseudopedobacter saltans]|uniref:SusC/RagA family TonB-linked outer membrane protein n=1 Tax=Pseudopedobacter saltans TaxID=151895 RepID=A0A2W5FCB4_9SPHI|nr:MAG: hypothetical protein DI598_00385 [Pseudopedobacter saltans]
MSSRRLTRLLLSLFVLIVSLGKTYAQKITIKGDVKTTDSKAIDAATIKVEGAKGSVVFTDTSGAFTIEANNGSRIVVERVGYKPKTITVSQDISYYSIVLEGSGSDNLDEVIVTGLSTVKRKDFAGAVTTLKSRDLQDRPVGSFDQLLQGKIPGLLALTSSGQPGNSTTIIIRGQSSIAGGNNPLYIIDGVPVEAGVFQAYNPNDFATLDVLRDASASAMYGSRGAAGVIVATTKRGQAGKAQVTYNANIGVKSRPDFAYSAMSTAELLQAQEDYGRIVNGSTGSYQGTTSIPGWYYSKLNPRYQALTSAGQLAADQFMDSLRQINTNWMDEIFRNGTFGQHTLSISGGGERTRIYSAVDLYDEQGTTLRTDMKRIAFRNNFDYKDDKLSVSVSSNLAFIKRDFQQSTTTNSTGNPFLAWVIAPSYQTVRKADGSYNTGTGTKYVANNMLDLTNLDRNYNNQINANIGTTIGYKLPEHFSLNLFSGFSFRETQSTNYGSKLAYSRVSSTTLTTNAGFQTEGLTRYFGGDIRPSLNYNNTFNKDHSLNLTLMGEYLVELNKSFSMTGYGIDPRTPNTPAAITTATASNQLYPSLGGGKSRNSLMSGMLYGTYSYKEKYTFTGSYRQDGSSKLPSDKRWVGFYSVGGIWNAIEESFLTNSKVLSNLRVSLSYGGAGNNASGNFAYGDFGYLPQYTNGSYAGITTIYSNNAGNSDLTWEKVYQWNLGIDFGFLQNRLTGNVNFYHKETKDMFVNRTMSATAGYGTGATIVVNAGTMVNKGIELMLNYDVIRSHNFLWSLTGNASYNRNRVTSLGGESSYAYGTSLLEVGKPLGGQYTVKWAGVDQATGAPLYYKLDGTITSTYSSSDQQVFGTWEAPWKGGFGTSISYKGLSLDVNFSWQRGATKSDNMQYFAENLSGFLAAGYNQASSLNFWKQPGDVATTPSPLYSTNFASNLLHSADFLRLKDVTLTYAIPKDILSKTKVVKAASVFVQGWNLFMWTKWRGPDPEAGATNINLSEYPNPKSITGGVRITF